MLEISKPILNCIPHSLRDKSFSIFENVIELGTKIYNNILQVIRNSEKKIIITKPQKTIYFPIYKLVFIKSMFIFLSLIFKLIMQVHNPLIMQVLFKVCAFVVK